jgi:hypothetical protein
MPRLSAAEIKDRAARMRERQKKADAAGKTPVAAPAPAPVKKSNKAERAEAREMLGDLYKAGLQDVVKMLGIKGKSKATNDEMINAILAFGKKTNYSVVKAAVNKVQ